MDTAESSHPFGVINSTFSSGAAQSRDTGHIDRKRRALFTGAVKRAIHCTQLRRPPQPDSGGPGGPSRRRD